jgi:hypothetical protein
MLQHLANELVGTPIDPLDGIAELSRERRVVHRVPGIHESPHHVLHPIGGFDDADEHVPIARVDAVQNHLGPVVEGPVEIRHERFFVHASLVQRPRCLRPPERPVVLALEQVR